MANMPANNVSTIRELLHRSREQIAMALPKHMDADRLMRVAMTSVQRNPALQEADPVSLLGAIIQSAQLGLEPDGVLGEAYLIPFKNRRKGITEVQFIVGFRGLISLARRSGEIVSIAAHCVYENDTFIFEYGLDEVLKHVPALENRGQMKAVYGVAKLKDGGHAIEVMSRSDIAAVRDSSQGYQSAVKYKKSHPWIDHYEEMARKTVIRRLAKYLPVSVEMMKAVAVDEQAEIGIQPQPVALEPSLTGTAADLNQALFGDQPAGSAALPPSPDAGEVEQTGQSPEMEQVKKPSPRRKSSSAKKEKPKQENAVGTNAVIEAFCREIDAVDTSLALDRWRMKHRKRICRALPNDGDQDAVFAYAEKRYRELQDAEKEPSQRHDEPEFVMCPSGNGNVPVDYCDSECRSRIGCPAHPGDEHGSGSKLTIEV